MAAEEVVGGASVRITPDTSKFAAQLRRDLKTATAGIKATPISITPSFTGFAAEVRRGTKEALASVKPPKLAVAPDLSKFGTQVKSAVASLKPPVVKIQVVPDTKGFATSLRAAIAAVRVPTVRVPVVAAAGSVAGNAAAQSRAAAAESRAIAARSRADAAASAAQAAQLRIAGAAAASQAAQFRAASAEIKVHSDRLKLFQLSSSSASGAAGELSGKVSSLSSSLGGLATGAATAGLQALSQGLEKAAQAAITFGAAVATIGLKSASSLAEMKLQIGSISSLLQDTSADHLIDQIRQLAVNSGVAAGAISGAVQRFVVMGTTGEDALRTVNSTLKGLAASGSLTEDSFKDTARALTQIGSKPFLQLEELNQIAEHLPLNRIQVMKQIAADTGDSLVDVQERFKQGTQQSGDALTAVVELLGKMDVSGQAIDNRTKTIGGAFNKLKETAKQSLGQLFEPLQGQIADALNDLDIGQLTQKVGKPIADSISAALPSILAAIPDVAEGLALTFAALAPIIADVTVKTGQFIGFIIDHQDQIKAAIDGIRHLFSNILPFIQDLKGPLEGIGRVLVVAFQNAIKVSDQVVKLEPSFKTLADNVETALNIIAAALKLCADIADKLVPTFTIVANAINFIFANSQKLVLATADLTLAALQKVAEGIDKLPNAGTVLGGLAGPGGAALGAGFDALRSKAGGLSDDIGEIRKGLKALSGTRAVATIDIITRRFDQGAQNATAGVAGAAKNVADIVNKTIKDLNKVPAGTPKFPNTGLDDAKNKADQLKNQLQAIYDRVLDFSKGIGEQSSKSIREFYDDLIDDLKKTNQNFLINWTKWYRENLVNLAKQRDEVEGMLSEAQDKLDDLKKASADLAQSIRDSFTTLGDPTNFKVVGLRQTRASLKQQLTNMLNDARGFADSMDTLRKSGLNETTLRQLAEAGPERGAEAARLLVQGGQDAIQQFNNANGELSKLGDKLGTGLSGQFYDAGIKAADGIVAGLKSQQDAIQTQLQQMANTFAKELKKDLKVGVEQAAPAKTAAAATAAVKKKPKTVAETVAIVNKGLKDAGAATHAAVGGAAIGKAAGNGVTKGMKQTVNKGTKSTVDSMMKNVRSNLKIFSPSKRMELEVGVPSGQGVIRGMVNSLHKAQAVTNSVINNGQRITSNINMPITVSGANYDQAQQLGRGIGLGASAVMQKRDLSRALAGAG